MAKIKVLSVEDSFPWRSINLSSMHLERHTIRKNENWRSDNEYELLFLSGAQKELFTFIGWDNRAYPPNRVEQTGLLAGKHYENTVSGKRFCVVYHVLPISDAKGSSAYIEYSAEMMHKAIVQLDEMERGQKDPCELLGWFHTHPNGLPTFMSSTDMITQRGVFNSEHNYSVVLNPHTLSWKAFRGCNADDAECRWLNVDTVDALCTKEAVSTLVTTDTKSSNNVQSAKKKKKKGNWKKRKAKIQRRRVAKRR